MDFKEDPFEFFENDEESNDAPEKYPILLIDEGKCSNSVKSLNAEKFGFRATIISTNKSQF